MIFESIAVNAQFLTALTAAIAVFSAIIIVAWPYLQRDQISSRLAQVASEKENIRIRERARLNKEPARVSLTAEPGKLFKEIVDRLNLAKQMDSGSIQMMLKQAGYRGKGPVIAFLAIRVIAPIVLFLISAIYVFLILKIEKPLLFKTGICLGATGLGYYLPTILIKNKIAKRQLVIKRAWPDALDLMLICVECGMGIDSCFRKVSEEIGVQCPELAEEMALTTAELSYLQDRRKAFENLGSRTGLEGVKAVVTSLIQSEKYGTGLAQALRVLSQESRDMRMAEAEKKAAGLPPKLTVPMMVFFLPSLFAAILSPAAIKVMGLH
jgi:tight adherence protein C